MVQQFLENQNLEPAYIQESSREEDLRANIEGLEDLPEEMEQGSYLYASRKIFTQDDFASLEKFSNQKVDVVNNSLIISTFKQPVPINTNSYGETLQANIFNSNSYVFWGKNEESNTLIFFQKFNDRTIYFNRSAVLLIFLNEKGEMVRYVQTMLIDEDEQEEKQDLIKAFDAVFNLYYNTTELSSGDKVTKTGLGYHNLTPLPNGVQVLAPTWNISVNNEKNYFVNAIEGLYYPRDDSSFLRETMVAFLKTLKGSKESTSLRVEFEASLSKIIESTIWGGEK
ncbi:two-component system regulatory protein YycI [Aquibacillus salsiterrae]|uniref:Two-component system regulatory protein YycI n=1 Tax=Aquibacillus salsiterrae TaxID=2950439 RepID=A0A9X3WER5_9BACI|nr:two-component system regulatory protein YycI [Aquibacillus salsiterrae]MDC3418490.1 two-component system regulatory protein YycI [Aquibacillus salsiterrae]